MAKKKEQPVSPIPEINQEKHPVDYVCPIRFKTYADKLRHPMWQRKRLEVYERDEWTCQMCNSVHIPLNVHHLMYNKGCEPWEYSNECLITLCEDCHEAETQNYPDSVDCLSSALKKHGAMSDMINAIGSAILERPFDKQIPLLCLLMFHDDVCLSLVTERFIEWKKEYKNNKDGKKTD